jgi:tRNA-dihydrouridine synthase C
MESLADRPMRIALARLQRRAAAQIQPADPRLDPPAVVAASRALLPRPTTTTTPAFDEACMEFLRVPGKLPPGGRVHVVARGVCRAYTRDELASAATPLAAQLMGSDPQLMAAAARHLVLPPAASSAGQQGRGATRGGRGARHVSLNCGCPANKVTGHGAGSSLLRDPHSLARLVASMSEALLEARREEEEEEEGHDDDALPPAPLLSVKVRAGFDDASLFEDNVLAAARDGGCGALVVHPRTKRQAYRGRADWRLIRRAVELLDGEEDDGNNNSSSTVPVVGNGDVVRAADALALALATGCSGVMIGRGAIQDPLIFLRARAAFAALAYLREEKCAAADNQDEALVRGGNGGDGDAARASRLVVEASAASAAAVRFGGEGGGGEAALIESFLREYVALADVETRRRRGGGRGSAARGAVGGGEGCGGDEGGQEEEEEEQHDGGGGGNERGRLGRLKSVLKYLFTGQPRLRDALEPILRVPPDPGASDAALERACAAVREHWRDGGPDAATPLVSHMML